MFPTREKLSYWTFLKFIEEKMHKGFSKEYERKKLDEIIGSEDMLLYHMMENLKPPTQDSEKIDNNILSESFLRYHFNLASSRFFIKSSDLFSGDLSLKKQIYLDFVTDCRKINEEKLPFLLESYKGEKPIKFLFNNFKKIYSVARKKDSLKRKTLKKLISI